MKAFLQGWALANPQRSFNMCALKGWVVSAPFDVVHSLCAPTFFLYQLHRKRICSGFSSHLFLEFVLDTDLFPFVDIITVENHALCCPDIRNWCPYWFLVHIFLDYFFSLF